MEYLLFLIPVIVSVLAIITANKIKPKHVQINVFVVDDVAYWRIDGEWFKSDELDDEGTPDFDNATKIDINNIPDDEVNLLLSIIEHERAGQ